MSERKASSSGHSAAGLFSGAPSSAYLLGGASPSTSRQEEVLAERQVLGKGGSSNFNSSGPDHRQSTKIELSRSPGVKLSREADGPATRIISRGLESASADSSAMWLWT